jgi:hypothetical protein
MELTELLRLIIEKLAPFVEGESNGRSRHDPDRDIEKLVVEASKVLDRGLLIGRGI